MTATHVKYLEPIGMREAVRLVCTCGQSHGAISWPNADMALKSGTLDPWSVRQWASNPQVGGSCRILAKRFNAVAVAEAAWPHRM